MVARNKAELIILSKAENIGLARLAAAAFAAQLDFTLTEIEEIKMAVSEAVTNSIVHGYGEAEGIIKVIMVKEGDDLTIEVVDEGAGMISAGLADPEKEGGEGLGLIFIENFMDQVQINSIPGEGTTIRMTIQAGKEGFEQEGNDNNG